MLSGKAGAGGEAKKSSKKPKAVKEEEEDEEEDEEEEEEPKPKKSPKKQVVAKDEDEDEEEEEEDEDEEEERPVKKSGGKKSKSDDREKGDDKTKFGIRLAYNGSKLRFDEEDLGFGHGAEFGVVANIPLTESLALNAGLNAVYRTPINYSDDYFYRKTYEYVVSAPVLLRYGFLDGLIYAEAGIQADIPLKTEEYTEETGYEPSYDECEWRTSFDFSVALGLGWNITEHFGIGIRGLYGLTKFVKEEEGVDVKLTQGSFGLTYSF
jgi:hypothetical protein